MLMVIHLPLNLDRCRPPHSDLGRGPHGILRIRNLMVPPAFDRRAGSLPALPASRARA
jgi:hypothetical protein